MAGDKGGTQEQGPIDPDILRARRLDKQAREIQRGVEELRRRPGHEEPTMTNPTNWRDSTANNTGLGRGPRVPRR